MTEFNPGNTSTVRGTDVLRDAERLPVVDESVAIMPVTDGRVMVKALDERDTVQAKSVAMGANTSALLSGLVHCGEHLEDCKAVPSPRPATCGRACPRWSPGRDAVAATVRARP